MKKFVETLGGIELFVFLAGVVFYFTGNVTYTYFCAAFSLLHSFLNVVFGDQNDWSSELATMLIAVVISLIIKKQMLDIIAVALCIASVLFGLPGLILVTGSVIASRFRKR